jgi:hypothetical protein
MRGEGLSIDHVTKRFGSAMPKSWPFGMSHWRWLPAKLC